MWSFAYWGDNLSVIAHLFSKVKENKTCAFMQFIHLAVLF